MPPPDIYYRDTIPTLTRANATGWAQVRCPFHDDANASLSVHDNNERGVWRCFALCGGGDLVSRHMNLWGLEFQDALSDLLRKVHMEHDRKES